MGHAYRHRTKGRAQVRPLQKRGRERKPPIVRSIRDLPFCTPPVSNPLGERLSGNDEGEADRAGGVISRRQFRDALPPAGGYPGKTGLWLYLEPSGVGFDSPQALWRKEKP